MTNNIFVRKTREARASGQSVPATFFLATLASVSTTEGVTIIPDGQDEAVPKKYKCLAGSGLLSSGDRVVVMKHSGTCVVLGKIGMPGGSGDDKVSKSGDTMTGNLGIDDTNPGVIGKATTRDSAEAADSNGNSVGFRLTDKNDNVVALYTDRYETSGEHGALISGYRMVNGAHVGNALRLLVDAAGNKIVYLTATAWRKALGLGNANGELPITTGQGGTGATSAAGHAVFAGPNASSAAAPSFRALVEADIPTLSFSKLSGTLPVDRGGTGVTEATTTSVVADIVTAASNYRIVSASFASWGKVAQLKVGVTATAAVSAATWHTIATLKTGKGSIQPIILMDLDQQRMQLSGVNLQVYGPSAQGTTYNFYATYLLA